MAKPILQVLSDNHLTEEQWKSCEAAYQSRFPEYRVVVMQPGLRLQFVEDAPSRIVEEKQQAYREWENKNANKNRGTIQKGSRVQHVIHYPPLCGTVEYIGYGRVYVNWDGIEPGQSLPCSDVELVE